MGFHSHLRRWPFFNGLSQRIQTLPKIAAGRLGTLKRPLLATTFLAAAAALGIWAEQIARSEATRAWERSHPPSAPIWRHALGSRGFLELQETRGTKDTGLFQQVSRSLPANLDDAAAVWISPNSRWIAVALPSGGDGPTALRVFCLECKKAPAEWKNWESQGAGWVGFESLLTRLDHLPKPPKAVEKQKKLIPADRREIRY